MLKKSTLSILAIVFLSLVFSYAAFGKWDRSRPADFTGTEFRMLGIHFVDEKIGCAVGDSGIIVTTKNGGATWEKMEKPQDKDLWDVQFINDKIGWASGDNGVILYTKDGGERWRRQDSVSTVALYGIYFLDERNGWAVGANGTIRATTNSGSIWASISGGS